MADNQYELNDGTEEEPKDNSTNMGLIIGLVVAVIVILGLLVFLFLRQDSGGGAEQPTPTVDSGGEGGEGGDGSTGMVIPTPLPGAPSFTVVAPDGANVRSGPSTDTAIVGALTSGASGQVTGITQDETWLQILVPQGPGGQGWVAAGLVQVENMGSVPVIPPVDGPTPTAEALMLFSVDQSPLAAGECTMLRWKVDNVSEVYVYVQGDNWADSPVTGEGNQEVCPEETTIYEMRVVQTDGNAVTQALTVEVIPEAGEDPLAGTNWQLASFAGDQATLPDTVITLGFDAAGGVNGNGGCNDYNGVYTVNGDQLTFGPTTTTRKLCGEEVDAQETLYLFALAETVTYALDGAQLILYDADGAEILRFNRIG